MTPEFAERYEQYKRRMSQSHRIAIAYREHDLPAVQSFVTDECGVECDEATAAWLCRKFDEWEKKTGECRWKSTTTGYVMWTRNRLTERGAFHVRDGGTYHDDRVCCDLHVFFLFIDETDEMIANLKNETAKALYQEARSRVFKTAQILTPIDKTAQRVAPER